ncbi:MAG: DUF1294 domain-containing protein [Clostridia bacterium]
MWIVVYFAAINAVTLVAFGIDKWRAWREHSESRVPERILIVMCVLGGALGGTLGMILFHHKVSKPKFRYTVPFLLLFYLVAFCVMLKGGII